jgi:RHS repeat-associated protein
MNLKFDTIYIWWIRVEKKQTWKLSRYINKNYEEETIWTWSWASIKISKYIDLNGKKIATIEKTDNNEEKVIYQQEDYLWWASIDLDENLNTLQIVDYYPYGKLRVQDHTDNYSNKYLYSKKERDIENWLDYFEARYYDSEVGRFNSIDRVYWELGETKRGKINLMFPQKLNAYSYSMNNPIVYTDVSGEDVLVWDWNGNPLEDLAKVYVWAVTFMWTYIAGKLMEYIDDKYEAKTVTSTTSSPPPNNWGNKKKDEKKDENSKSKTANQIQESISKQKAPKDVKRLDTWKVKGEQDHIHFKENNSALNRDWTWKHWDKNLSNAEKTWLETIWWKVPK